MALLPGDVQLGFALHVEDGAVGSLVQQDRHNVNVAIKGGKLQCSPALIPGIDVNTVLEDVAGVEVSISLHVVQHAAQTSLACPLPAG